jgi:hypothetical protein
MSIPSGLLREYFKAQAACPQRVANRQHLQRFSAGGLRESSRK